MSQSPTPSSVVEQRTKWGESVVGRFGCPRLSTIPESRLFSRQCTREFASTVSVRSSWNTTMSAVLRRNCHQNGGHGGVFEGPRFQGRGSTIPGLSEFGRVRPPWLHRERWDGSELRPASRLVHSCASEFRPARPDALVTETRGRETDRLGGTPPCPLFTLLLLGTADIVVCFPYSSVDCLQTRGSASPLPSSSLANGSDR